MKQVRTVFLCGPQNFAVKALAAGGAEAVFAESVEAAAALLTQGNCRAVVASSAAFGPQLLEELGRQGLLLGVAAFGAVDAAERQPDAQILRFFSAGADECFYAAQPEAEIRARFTAVLRRMSFAATDGEVAVDGLALDLSRRSATLDNVILDLTRKEFGLLVELLRIPGRVVERRELLGKIWGPDYFGSPRTVDVHISRLRAKLGGYGRRLVTVPCLGYKLERSGKP